MSAMIVTVRYRFEECEPGHWRAFRRLWDADERPLLRSGSTVTPARWPNRSMCLAALRHAARVDRGAATRLGVEVRIVVAPWL